MSGIKFDIYFAFNYNICYIFSDELLF
ncbi:hypothetical protein CHELA20_53083 [Hyphomicrobiales bacterium]|nr:hypothetical protein CHELA41_21842 [Hyphomicrobiales bacterium]CAH1683540.1 hypothetical protein CHELA20_53083 [Hyphomicrobiales bacterium]